MLTHANRYEQLTIRAASLREELHTQVERILNDVIHFKVHIQKKLADYELFVDEELSHEVENIDQDRDIASAGADDDMDMSNVEN
jgi:kinetochore protein NDC80